MKKLFYLLITILSQLTFANVFPGEYKYCYDQNNKAIDAYLNIVDFKEEGTGIQIYKDGFPISVILKLDGSKYTTRERISGFEFEYSAFYKNGILKIVFTDKRDAEVLGLNQTQVIKFEGMLATFVYNQEKIYCRMRLACDRPENCK